MSLSPYFKELNLENNSSLDKVKDAYKRAALTIQSGVNDQKSLEKFLRVHRAYRAIFDSIQTAPVPDKNGTVDSAEVLFKMFERYFSKHSGPKSYMSKTGDMVFGFVFDDSNNNDDDDDDDSNSVSSDEEDDDDDDDDDCDHKKKPLPPGYSYCKNCPNIHPIPGYKKMKHASIVKDEFFGPPMLTIFKVVKVSNSSIKLAWSTHNLDIKFPIQFFLVQMDFSNQANKLFETVYDGSAYEYEVPSLVSGTTYNFRIQSWDKNGVSRWSNILCASTTGPKADIKLKDHPPVLSNIEIEEKIRKEAKALKKKEKKEVPVVVAPVCSSESKNVKETKNVQDTKKKSVTSNAKKNDPKKPPAKVFKSSYDDASEEEEEKKAVVVKDVDNQAPLANIFTFDSASEDENDFKVVSKEKEVKPVELPKPKYTAPVNSRVTPPKPKEYSKPVYTANKDANKKSLSENFTDSVNDNRKASITEITHARQLNPTPAYTPAKPSIELKSNIPLKLAEVTPIVSSSFTHAVVTPISPPKIEQPGASQFLPSSNDSSFPNNYFPQTGQNQNQSQLQMFQAQQAQQQMLQQQMLLQYALQQQQQMMQQDMLKQQLLQTQLALAALNQQNENSRLSNASPQNTRLSNVSPPINQSNLASLNSSNPLNPSMNLMSNSLMPMGLQSFQSINNVPPIQNTFGMNSMLSSSLPNTQLPHQSFGLFSNPTDVSFNNASSNSLFSNQGAQDLNSQSLFSNPMPFQNNNPLGTFNYPSTATSSLLNINNNQLNNNHDDTNLDDDFSAEIAGLVFNKPPGFVN